MSDLIEALEDDYCKQRKVNQELEDQCSLIKEEIYTLLERVQAL
jgi:hypothetical protein